MLPPARFSGAGNVARQVWGLAATPDLRGRLRAGFLLVPTGPNGGAGREEEGHEGKAPDEGEEPQAGALELQGEEGKEEAVQAPKVMEAEGEGPRAGLQEVPVTSPRLTVPHLALHSRSMSRPPSPPYLNLSHDFVMIFVMNAGRA